VADRIRETQSINDRFRQEMQRYDASMRDAMFMKLLTQDRFLTPEDRSAAMGFLGLIWDDAVFTVLFVEHAPERALQDIALDEKDAKVIYTALSASRYVVLVATAQGSDVGHCLAQIAFKLGDARIGASQQDTDPSRLGFLLAEASAACSRHDPKTAPYLSYDALFIDTETMYYPIEQEIKMIAAAREGDDCAVLSILEDIHERNLVKRTLAPPMRRSLYTNMATTAAQVLDYLQDGQRALYTKLILILTSLESGGASEETIFAEIAALYRSICLALRSQNENKNSSIVQNVIAFLEEQYARQDMSLDVVAEHLGASYYFLSRIFQEEAHQSFSDILNDIRIRRAIKLLEDKTIAIQQAAEAVGYTNMSTFLRAFKKRTGTTPAAYRKAMDSKGENE
jgi:AraC-like DNA-binding protein